MTTVDRWQHARGRKPLYQRRWFLRLAAISAAFVVLTSSWSLVVAARPGNESFVAKAADWARENHLGGVVNWVEAQYYTWKAPPKGGTPKRAIEIATTTTTTTAPKPTTTTAPPHPHSAPPENIVPFASPPIDNEGVWYPIGPSVEGYPTVLAAQLRPDAEHTSVLGAVVWMDPKTVRFQLIPGTVEPGGDWAVKGTVPGDALASVIGAFNGGFRFQDAEGGFFNEGRESHPLVPGQASIVVRNDGSLDIVCWARDATLTPDVTTVRQNLSLIVDGGQPVPDLDATDTHKWGATLGNKVLVWRSGVGVRADGTLVYAASNGLSVLTLATMLARAGAVRAMELDINPEWVTYDVFAHPDPNNPAAIDGTKLLPDMQRPGNRYLQEESRDFVAIYAR